MINDIRVYFSSNANKAYHCVSGSVFNDEFGETLDSSSIILDEISKQDRLSNIEPYEYVKIVNNSDSFLESKFMLVDNYVEKETNIHEHIYQYTINLMSETKLLEKIQCPNLVITHSKVTGKKKIYQYIDQYMQLYCPKVKTRYGDGSWDYNYIINWDIAEGSPLYKKFNVDCADLTMSLPTLRQLLTSLMQQVGCIPVVKNRELLFLDFKQEKAIFNKVDSINYIQKSLSSDSYVNTLVNHYNQVLDTSNEVISETIGFRNRNNVLLKQTENLTLETKFPIYEVNKFIFKLAKPTTVLFKSINTNDHWFNGAKNETYYPEISKISFSIKNSRTLLIDNLYFFVGARTGDNTTTETRHDCIIKNLEINVCRKYEGETYGISYENFYNIGKITILKDGVYLAAPPTINTTQKEFIIDINTGVITDGTQVFDYQGYWYKIENVEISVDEEITNIDDIALWMKDEIKDEITGEKTIQFVPFVEKNGVIFTYENSKARPIYSYYNIDITPLLVENSKRNLLEVNFTEMENAKTIEELSKYVYGTVGYTIGTKQISGFSQQYTEKDMWWGNNRTYIENIINFIKENASTIIKKENFDNNSFVAFRGEIPFDYISQIYYNKNLYINSTDVLFSLLLFDIKYQPLNTYNLKYVKEDKDIPLFIEQLDSSNSAIVDFDRTSLNEQEKVNRLGNDVITINQVTDNYEEIQPLNSLYEDYTIFKRTISFENGYFSVNYTASKNYIMQNYFTSITTKYRAYENVDYNQSVIRKENQTVFVYFTENSANSLYNAKDKYIKNLEPSLLISGLTNFHKDNNLKVNYSYEKDSINSYKNDVSVISTNNIIAFIYENYDNVSPGSYLAQNSVNEDLGGLPQSWIMYSNDYYQSHEVGYFFNALNALSQENANKLPLIIEKEYKKNVIFNLVDDNTTNSLSRTYYKDNAEIINQTVQFIYYTNSKNILWTESFLKNNKMVDSCNVYPTDVLDITGKEFSVSYKHTEKINDVKRICSLEELISGKALYISSSKIMVNWTSPLLQGVEQFVITCQFGGPNENNLNYYDFMAFRKSITNYQDFYYGLNDTKTFRIYNTIKEGENKDLIYLE